MIPVFDGHNDFLWRLLSAPEKRETLWFTGDGSGHLDLPRMKAGGFAGGFFAIWVPSPPDENGEKWNDLMANPPYEVPLPALISFEEAAATAQKEAGHLLWLERTGALKICRSVADIRGAMAEGKIAAILHMEGAEAIDESLDALHLWHGLGLRSLGPVWSRPTIFGHGVPFAFPSSPDTGPGLTEAGKRLVAECNALKIMLDLSHLNEKGFDDVAALSDAPLVATHSNAHAITPSSRNLTDRQLRLIAETKGMVGLNYSTSFLRGDGGEGSDIGWESILRHMDHLLSILGEDHLGLGSDFDGATMPDGIKDVTGQQALLQAFRDHGYGEELVEKLAWKNWLGTLERVWG